MAVRGSVGAGQAVAHQHGHRGSRGCWSGPAVPTIAPGPSPTAAWRAAQWRSIGAKDGLRTGWGAAAQPDPGMVAEAIQDQNRADDQKEDADSDMLVDRKV